MGKRGPRPTPTSLKVAHGTYRADRDGEKDAEVAPPPLAHLDPPDSLGEIGQAKWREVAPLLNAEGLLTKLDSGALETYCRAHDEIAKCDAQLTNEAGESVEYFTAESGYVGQHPAVNQRFKWLDVKRRYEAEFGMTASSRSGLVGNKPKTGGVKARKRTG